MQASKKSGRTIVKAVAGAGLEWFGLMSHLEEEGISYPGPGCH
jgi:hypothetical protein